MMAKKLYKNVLDPTKLQELYSIASQYFPEKLRDKFLEAIKSTGTIPDDLFRQGNFNVRDQSVVLDMVNTLTGGKPLEVPLSKSELQQELTPQNEPIDEPSLTDEALARRKDVYDTLSQTGGILDRAYVERLVDNKFKSFKIKSSIGNEAGKLIVDEIMQTNQYPDAGRLDQLLNPLYRRLGNTVGLIDPLKNFVNDQNARNDISSNLSAITNPENKDKDVKRIADMIAKREIAAERESSISSYISGLPNELAEGRRPYFDTLDESGGRSFQDQAPAIIATEHALGRGTSGALGDVLASSRSDIQFRIESEKARVMSADDDFYFNAAYNNQVRKILEGRTDFNSALDTERQNVRQQQEKNFQDKQFYVRQEAATDLLMQKYQAQLERAQLYAQTQRDSSKQRRQADLFGGIGQSMTAIGTNLGFLSGGPIVAAIGGGIGAGIGAGLPIIFRRQR